MEEIKEGLNVAEASLVLGVSRPVVYDLLKRRDNPLPSIRIGRRRVIPRHALLEWMNAEARQGGTESAT